MQSINYYKPQQNGYEEVQLQLPVELMNLYKDTLPKIQLVRNSGFTGSAMYAVKRKLDTIEEKPKMEKRTFLPVNHFITNHNININIHNNYNSVATPKDMPTPSKSDQQPEKPLYS